MARKKSGNAAGNGILFGVVLVGGAIASVPKSAWITIGVIAGITAFIGAIAWLSSKRAARQVSQHGYQATQLPNPQKESRKENTDSAMTFSRSVVAPAHKATPAEPEFHKVQLGVASAPEFRIPEPVSQRPNAEWMSAGETVTVAEFSIPGGLLYVGDVLGSYDAQEPSLINPKLRIAKSHVDVQQRLMPYWPSYHSISPEARRGYLQWLAGGRNDPEADTGYVFLFFYGLERRALLDAQCVSTASAEIPAIITEVHRLLDIYGGNRSFRGYATGLLSHIGGTAANPNLYLSRPPEVAPIGYEMPLPLRIALGQHAVNKHPMDADWAHAWALGDPNISKRTPVTRCGDVFASLFKLRYDSFHPKGLILPQNKTKLKASYRPASSVLRVPATAIDDLPDVMATSATRKIIQLLVEVCTTELEPYSRYLGRNPDAASTLEGLLQLPVTLWPQSARTELDDLEVRIGDDLIIMSFGELAGRFKSAGTLSRDKVLALARALESRQIGMEPDVLAGSRTPKAEDRIALFLTQPEDGALRASAAYNAASVTLDLASAVASADGDTSLEEVALLSNHIDSWNHLSVAHQKRLKAHLQIQLQQPPTLASLKKRLDPLPTDAKRTIASFLAHLAQADGTVSPSEVKLLERVYKTLQLDSQLLYSDLHGAAAGSSAASIKAAGPETQQPDTAVSGATQQAGHGGFTLDHERIAQLQRETAAVSALLAQVFTEDQADDQFSDSPANTSERAAGIEAGRVEAHATSSDIPGLDLEHSAFLRLLVSRTEWSRSELEEVASDMELMLDGALEQINDMGFDRFNMPVTEGDDPVEINADILEELAL
jgi:uncharacterized tellurite resistance protein B-like protein